MKVLIFRVAVLCLMRKKQLLFRYYCVQKKPYYNIAVAIYHMLQIIPQKKKKKKKKHLNGECIRILSARCYGGTPGMAAYQSR